MTAYLEYNGQRIAIAGQTATVTDKPQRILTAPSSQPTLLANHRAAGGP